ncbi:MAG: NnrS family protein [Hyphomicrobiales bacterium]|nr:NnrS family protein [Hyphomicrobiales bacterium]MDE2286113.1 NnrS family protein [Hyphomicrobiales bacterium]MDE2373653.1 NnrS family protein [Hyphomicrobiales bacterium]
MAIPRYRRQDGPAFLSAGFRPFFLLAAFWAAVAIPIWLIVLTGQYQLPSKLSPVVWHVHEMIFGYGAAVVAGFLLTAIPNWTGRMPLQDGPLVLLLALWMAGRFAVMFSAALGAQSVAVLDLAFPAVFAIAVAREIVAGGNWRNLPMLAALLLLLAGNLLVHLGALGVAPTAEIGNRIGVATLLLLISLIGGRIIPSFTRNWLAKARPQISAPATFGAVDRAALAIVALTLAVWAYQPNFAVAAWLELLAGLTVGLRLARWRGHATLREPLVTILHIGYGWLALGFLLLAANHFVPILPPTAALHAFTVGAIGTMTLAVMTRASLGHTGRPVTAGRGTTTIYALVTIAAVVRLIAPLGGAHYILLLAVAGAAWSGAFGLFVLLYAKALALPRARDGVGQPI